MRASVNKGPLEIAQVFLAVEQVKTSKYAQAKLSLLRTKFEEMIDLCQQAVKISADNSPDD